MSEECETVSSWGHLQPLLLHGETDGYLLPIPGSYGREALIRPYLDSCPCRRRSGRENDALKISRCANCKSVRSLAPFIPRNDLLRFSFADDMNSNRVLLEVSGNNSMQIVHLNRQGVSPSTSNQDSCVVIHHGDEISLHWEVLGLATSDDGDSNEQPLVRFRVVRIQPNPNGVSQNVEKEKRQKFQSLDNHNNIEIESDNRVTSDIDELNVSMCHNESISQVVMADDDRHEESPTQGESAPLTMPLHFNDVSSRSCSYESKNIHDFDPTSEWQEEREVTSSQTTPQKCNTSVKRKFEDKNNRSLHSEYRIETEETQQTPQISVPIASLSYNELQRLKQESNDTSSKQHSLVRNAILSLTLALTSNASAWDSSFLDACKNEDSKKEVRLEQTEKWIPRLLQKTRIQMRENIT